MKKKKMIIIILILILIIGFLLIQIFKVQDIILKNFYPTTYSEYVYKYSEENGIDPLLTFAIIKAESNFDTNTVSHKGAIGLMQLMPATANEVAEKTGVGINSESSLYIPEQNIKIGTSYYKSLLDRYDNSYLVALAAYNAGIGNVDEWISEGIIRKDGSNIENIPFKETNNYVRKIVRDYRIYINLYEWYQY